MSILCMIVEEVQDFGGKTRTLSGEKMVTMRQDQHDLM